MADVTGGQESGQMPDIRSENPYQGNFYEAAKYNGQRFVDWLLDSATSDKLNPHQVNHVLTCMYQNFSYDPHRRETMIDDPGEFFNQDPKFEPVNDWVIEVIANAQDQLATRTGVKPPGGGNDARTSRSRPTIKYKPSTK